MILAAFLVACARLAPEPEGGGSFPHPEGYAEGSHGVDALAADASCWSCHATDTDTQVSGASPAAPTCLSCHALYPHDESVRASASHGALWLDAPEDCAACHGEAGDRAPAEREEARCVSCHSSYPHPEGWAEAEAHGSAVLARGSVTACASCHDADGPEEGRCSSCHSFPHPEGWAAGAVHGAAWLDQPATCTEGCHPAAPEAGELGCVSCHDLFPHVAGWPQGHLQVVQNRGEVVCSRCHEAGSLDAPVLPVSCAAGCHQEGL